MTIHMQKKAYQTEENRENVGPVSKHGTGIHFLRTFLLLCTEMEFLWYLTAVYNVNVRMYVRMAIDLQLKKSDIFWIVSKNTYEQKKIILIFIHFFIFFQLQYVNASAYIHKYI